MAVPTPIPDLPGTTVPTVIPIPGVTMAPIAIITDTEALAAASRRDFQMST
ncbi:MAG: hypothetical protein Q4B85_11830 [Lachnospiraceae bacterium]|nr:hypothetical protein [Lachnospiraceae bacterium]